MARRYLLSIDCSVLCVHKHPDKQYRIQHQMMLYPLPWLLDARSVFVWDHRCHPITNSRHHVLINISACNKFITVSNFFTLHVSCIFSGSYAHNWPSLSPFNNFGSWVDLAYLYSVSLHVDSSMKFSVAFCKIFDSVSSENWNFRLIIKANFRLIINLANLFTL